MVPLFLPTGLLKPGIHWADNWLEIETRFGGSARRQNLLIGLSRAIALLQSCGCPAVYLDGSFTTSKLEPGDFDACWETTGVSREHLDPVFKEFSNKRAAQKARFSGEFFPVSTNAKSGDPRRELFDLFQRDKDTGVPKGIVGLNLKTIY